MLVNDTLRWCLAVVVLQLALVLPTEALSDNETTGDLALQILSVSPTAVNVQWNCPSTDNVTTLQWEGVVKNAVAKWNRSDTKVIELCQNASIGQQVKTVITDLEEGVEYQLSLIQLDVTLSSVKFQTLTSVPSGPPIYLRGHSVNPAGLHISWSRPKLLDCNGDILQYIIVVDNGLDTRNYTFNVTRECISRACTNIECMSHSFTASENNELVPHNKYSVKVAAVNVNGTGPFSSAIEVMSGDNEPGPPENLRVINSDEESDMFILQWDMPRNPNGAIIRYKIEYGVTNDTTASDHDYTESMNYTLHLLSNETYTIAVYAENSVGLGRAVQIQWSSSGDGTSSSNSLEAYKYIIIGSCVGAFLLILLVCTIIVYVKSKYKKSNAPKRSKSSQFYPAEVTTVVNLGYIYAERGSNSLPYDYPYVEANGAQALSTTTFHTSTKSSNRNSTGTCGYIEVSTVLNGGPKPHPASSSVPNSPSNISKHPSTASSPNSTDHQYVNANHVPATQNDTRALLSPPANGAEVSTEANTHSDNGYVTLRS